MTKWVPTSEILFSAKKSYNDGLASEGPSSKVT